MYQIGISSVEKKAPIANAMELNSPSAAPLQTGCPVDEITQTEKSQNPKDTLAHLMQADFQFEGRPSYRNHAIAFVFAIVAIGTASIFAFSTVPTETSVATIEKEVVTPKPDKQLVDNTKIDPNVDHTITGAISGLVSEDKANPALPELTRDTANERVHLVKAGDTLYDIAKKYGTTIAELVEDNGIENPGRLKLNTKLIIH